MRSLEVRKENATSPKHIGTNSMKDSIQKLLETSFFFFLLTTRTLSQTERSVDPGFFQKKRENDALYSTEAGVVDALCKIQGSAVPSRSGKKVSKVTQTKLSGRLTGNMKFF